METRKTRRVETKTVDISVVVPVVRTPSIVKKAKLQFDKVPRNVRLIACFVGMTVVASAMTYNFLAGNERSGAATNQADLVKAQLRQAYYELEYDTILPKDKTIHELGGWRKVSPPDRNPVFAFADKIGSTNVSISEQPLPDEMRADADGSIKELAQQFGATQKLGVSGTDVYIGTSTNGPQSAIFHKDGLLVLIKSTAKITDDDWVQYVKALQ